MNIKIEISAKDRLGKKVNFEICALWGVIDSGTYIEGFFSKLCFVFKTNRILSVLKEPKQRKVAWKLSKRRDIFTASASGLR